jgi:hypothetical protein
MISTDEQRSRAAYNLRLHKEQFIKRYNRPLPTLGVSLSFRDHTNETLIDGEPKDLYAAIDKALNERQS